jgi:hypothetical protein
VISEDLAILSRHCEMVLVRVKRLFFFEPTLLLPSANLLCNELACLSLDSREKKN